MEYTLGDGRMISLLTVNQLNDLDRGTQILDIYGRSYIYGIDPLRPPVDCLANGGQNYITQYGVETFPQWQAAPPIQAAQLTPTYEEVIFAYQGAEVRNHRWTAAASNTFDGPTYEDDGRYENEDLSS